MAQRGLASFGLLVAALCHSVVLPAALGGSAPANWAAWAVLFGGFGVATMLAARGDPWSWRLAGVLGAVFLVVSLVVQLSGLPGQHSRSWDVLATVALVAEGLVLLLWLLAARGAGRPVLPVSALGAAVAVVAALLPLGNGAATEPPRTIAALSGDGGGTSAHAGHDHVVAAPTATVLASDSGTLEEQLAAARGVVDRWPTLADARADGWTLADDYIPGVGSHWMHYDRIDSVFDPAEPEMLLFAGDEPDAPVVGLTYYVVHSPPAGFAGDQDVWHQHKNVCMGPDGPRFAGDGASGCKARWDWSWMLHAWVAPGWENPDGVFANENPLV